MTSTVLESGRNPVGTICDIERLEEIIGRAGEIARGLFDRRDEFLVDEKSPGQFVSDADRQIEGFLRKELACEFGECPVIGEEYGGTFDGNGWVIDPIDGTSNFLCGIPLWSISVAYMQGGEPLLAAVFAPAMNVLVASGKGQGLRKNGEPFRRRDGISAVPTYSIGENTVWRRDEIRKTTEGLRQEGIEVVRLRSASYSLSMVAQGQLDGFIEEHLKLWDIAAGWLLCLEGGVPVRVQAHDGHVRSIWTGVRQ